MAEINFSCGRCGQRIVADADAAGLLADCPNCRQPLTIPIPGLDGEFEAGPREEFPGELAAEVARWQARAEILNRECANLHLTVLHTRSELKSFQSERLILLTELTHVREKLNSGSGNLELNAQIIAELRAEVDSLRAELEQTRQREADRALERQEELDTTREALTLAQAGELGAKQEAAALQDTCSQLNLQISTLRNDLRASAEGAELLNLRERIGAAEEAQRRWEVMAREATAAKDSSESAAAEFRGLLEEARRELASVRESQFQESPSQALRENESLRGVIARQNEDLKLRFQELARLKKARWALRIIYWLFGLVLLVIVLVILEMLPEVVSEM